MPGPIRPETEVHHGSPPPAKALKNIGSIGEMLEGDVYTFKLVSMRPCGDQPSAVPPDDPKARIVVGAEVEITTNTKLNVSPRHLSLGKGGILLDGNVDPKRLLKGCTPLLNVALLKKGDVTKGFVLFDVPASGPGSNWREMNLVYLPRRFGGSSQVLVKLGSG
jgi:hypothetical protein